MAKNPHEKLSSRERQIMEIVYKMGTATTKDIWEQLPDPPCRAAVRTHLRILEKKGHLGHTEDGPRFIYKPTVSREKARRSVLQNILRTFFGGSREELITTLLDDSVSEVTEEEMENLAGFIEEARRKGR